MVNGQCPNEPMGHLDCGCGIACEIPNVASNVLPVVVAVVEVVMGLAVAV